MKQKEVLNNLFLVFMILALCIPNIAKDKIVESKWTSDPVKIDGSNNDWDSSALIAQKKVDVDYAFMNDAENLYILFIFKNPKYLSSINMTGMTVWFYTKGMKKKDCGLKFIKKKISADDYISLLEKKGETIPEAQKSMIRANESYILYDHKMITKKAEFSSKDSEGKKLEIPIFRSRTQQKTVFYEFSIPLKKVVELAAGIGAEPGKSLKVGFEWGGASKEMKEAAASRIGSQDSKATASRATGSATQERRVSSGSGGLSRIRRSLPKKYSFWVEVKLAQNQ